MSRSNWCDECGTWSDELEHVGIPEDIDPETEADYTGYQCQDCIHRKAIEAHEFGEA